MEPSQTQPTQAVTHLAGEETIARYLDASTASAEYFKPGSIGRATRALSAFLEPIHQALSVVVRSEVSEQII
jgi:hypothetical protein